VPAAAAGFPPAPAICHQRTSDPGGMVPPRILAHPAGLRRAAPHSPHQCPLLIFPCVSARASNSSRRSGWPSASRTLAHTGILAHSGETLAHSGQRAYGAGWQGATPALTQHRLSVRFGDLCAQRGELCLQRLNLRLDLPLERAAPFGQLGLAEDLEAVFPTGCATRLLKRSPLIWWMKVAQSRVVCS
jgi:hypothetical protein